MRLDMWQEGYMQLTAGIIGCGNVARFHFAGLKKAGVRLKWVCDINEDVAKPWANEFQADVTTDYKTVLADPEVQFVTITADSSTHRKLCLDAIDAGKSVICEKTLAENPDDSFEIVARARDRGVILYTSYMKRFIPAVQKARELLPRVGRIISTHVRTYQCWGDLWHGVPRNGFFGIPTSGVSRIRRSYGGGILYCGGSHILDLVCWLLGRPNRAYASIVKPDGFDYELHVAALLETNNGAVHFDALAHPFNRIGFLRDGWDERIEIIGSDGRLEILSAQWDQYDVKSSRLTHYDQQSGNETVFMFDPVSPFERAVCFFCEHIAQGVQGSQEITTGYDVDELIAHMIKSMEQRRPLDIHWRI
jgi:predicted dehydrogenase